MYTFFLSNHFDRASIDKQSYTFACTHQRLKFICQIPPTSAEILHRSNISTATHRRGDDGTIGRPASAATVKLSKR